MSNEAPSTEDTAEPTIALGAVVTERGHRADELISEFVSDLIKDGVRIGGLIQNNLCDEDGEPAGIELVDIQTRDTYRISQELGKGSASCMVDPAGLAEATKVLREARDKGVKLLVISRFSGLEAEGKGLIDDLMSAVSDGVPVLIVVSQRHLEAWNEATGELSSLLRPIKADLISWWQSLQP